MAKGSFLLGLITGLLALLSCTIALDITDVFTLQPGAANIGGCDDRKATLNLWFSETIVSLRVTMDQLGDIDNINKGTRRAMAMFFGISSGNMEKSGAPTYKAIQAIRRKC